ncbi:MAG: hypothetical protein GKS01_06235 [Alphaproteobacteria bacterium]|nr:hypothetical protein [Alphaproteobacteria bacterium]
MSSVLKSVETSHSVGKAPHGQQLSATRRTMLDEMGYVHIPGFFDVGDELQPIIDDIARCGERICDEFDFYDASYIEALGQEQRSTLYNLLRYLPSLTRLTSSETLLDSSRRAGMEFPMVLRSYNIRMDTPNRDEFLFHWHQDITYLLGSANTLTYWIPLVEVDENNGSVEVVPGSHRQGIRPFRYTGEKALARDTVLSPSDARLIEEPETAGVTITAKPGDLVLFSQFLLHRSTPNRSRQTRWTVQIRHADAFDQNFIDAGYPCGDATNIFHTDLFGHFSAEEK